MLRSFFNYQILRTECSLKPLDFDPCRFLTVYRSFLVGLFLELTLYVLVAGHLLLCKHFMNNFEAMPLLIVHYSNGTEQGAWGCQLKSLKLSEILCSESYTQHFYIMFAYVYITTARNLG